MTGYSLLRDFTKLAALAHSCGRTLKAPGKDEQYQDIPLSLFCILPQLAPYAGAFHQCKPLANALIAFTGLDPKVRQSGRTLQRNTRLTKRGSPYLRKALFVAASIAQRHDSDLKEYYEKKRSEGKPYRVATVAVARKLIHRVYAVWKRSEPYVACGKRLDF